MTAPPARPHVLRSPHQSLTSEWGLTDDDPWDSTSDPETTPSAVSKAIPIQRKTGSPLRNASGRGTPQRKDSGSSSSNLAFSYTHVTAPSANSYPTKGSILSNAQQPRNLSSGPAGRMERTESSTSRTGWTYIASSGGGDLNDQSLSTIDIDEDAAMYPVRRLKQGKEAIKYDVDDLVNDPLHVTKRGSPDNEPGNLDTLRTQKQQKFIDCLVADDINIADLRKLAWSGIPDELRPISWQLLLGYLPLSSAQRISTLARKRQEYASLVELTFARGKEGLDQQIWHQIEIDVPRTRPGVRLWMERGTQRSLERILYVWAIRHPTSGYVQGINDLVTPFFQIFLGSYIDSDPEDFDPSLLPEHVLTAIEADCFWCLSRLLDGIQDNYITAQPGIHRSVGLMAELVSRIDPTLYKHLESQNVEFMQFAFRWMNCLLMRELSVKNTIRMWDTYLAEGTNAFSEFHLYVCCAFLTKWSDKLKQMDFQGIIMFLQSLPTQTWGDHEIQMLLSESFVLSSVWGGAQSHFSGSKNTTGTTSLGSR